MASTESHSGQNKLKEYRHSKSIALNQSDRVTFFSLSNTFGSFFVLFTTNTPEMYFLCPIFIVLQSIRNRSLCNNNHKKTIKFYFHQFYLTIFRTLILTQHTDIYVCDTFILPVLQQKKIS